MIRTGQRGAVRAGGWRWWALAGAGLLLAACTSVVNPGGALPITSVSPLGDDTPPDAAMLEQHARIVAAYGGVYHNPELEKTLALVVGRLVAASDDPSKSYRITILNAPAINAFALPEGYLYVTRGLLALANDSSEIAAVLAHEIAHVTANHAAARQDRARTAEIVSRVVTDVLNDEPAGRQALTSSREALASFSRQQELEADAIGIRTTGKAGFDPYAASRFLAAMGRFADYRASLGIAQDQRPEFLSSHPSTPERVELAIRAARQFGAPGIIVADRTRYLEGVKGIVYGDDTAQGYVRGRNFFHATLGVGFQVPEGFVIDNTREAVLATGQDGTALRFDAVNISATMSLDAYLNSGWVNGLVEESVRTFQINGLAAASAGASARGWEFRITVIRVGGATYRFIFASEDSTPAFDRAATETAASFRQLTRAEAAGLRPLVVKIVTVRAGDTPQSLAARMTGVEHPLDLFYVLNGLDAAATLAPGMQVKVVGDG